MKEKHKTAPGAGSVDPSEIARFSAMAAEWWDSNGKFRPLHKFNPVRLAFIQDTVLRHFSRTLKEAGAPGTLFEGLRLLDIGCGGGLLSEPMTRLGARVTGADAAEANISAASVHAAEQGLDIDYRTTTAEELAAQGAQFDVILNMEVMEHVADLPSFIRACSQMLAPGGLMICATLNRTLKALGLAIIGAEYILRWLPVGTHTWSKFITPEELEKHLRAAGLDCHKLTGVVYNPLMDQWSLSRDTGVNYMAIATHPPVEDTHDSHDHDEVRPR